MNHEVTMGDFLTAIRESRGLTQKEAANLSTWDMWPMFGHGRALELPVLKAQEAGRHMPNTNKMHVLHSIYDMSDGEYAYMQAIRDEFYADMSRRRMATMEANKRQ